MKNISTLCLLSTIAAVLCSCSGWQSRADDLQQSADSFAAASKRHKFDFVRHYGAPSKCAKLATGERCEWEKLLDSMDGTQLLSAEFNVKAELVKAQGLVRRGGREYVGRHKQVNNDPIQITDAREIYDRMFAQWQQDPDAARTYFKSFPSTVRDDTELFIRNNRGKVTATFSQFDVDQRLAPQERDFVTFFMKEFSDYKPTGN
jgi:hypothetical protein